MCTQHLRRRNPSFLSLLYYNPLSRQNPKTLLQTLSPKINPNLHGRESNSYFRLLPPSSNSLVIETKKMLRNQIAPCSIGFIVVHVRTTTLGHPLPPFNNQLTGRNKVLPSPIAKCQRSVTGFAIDSPTFLGPRATHSKPPLIGQSKTPSRCAGSAVTVRMLAVGRREMVGTLERSIMGSNSPID